MGDARAEFIRLVEDQWTDPLTLTAFAGWVHDELVARPDLLVRLLGLPRPGPCGDQPGGVAGPSTDLFCSLDSGHTGCHQDGQAGAVWREVRGRE